MKHTRILAITAAIMLMASPVMAAGSKSMTKSDTTASAAADTEPAAGKKHHRHRHHKKKHDHKHVAAGDARMAGDHHNMTMHRHKHDKRKAHGPVHRSVRSSPGYQAHRGGADGAGGWTAQ